jgi:hypothetical protein
MTSADNPLLKEEYFHLNKIVEDFDQRALTIKAWSVTLSMAGIGAAYTNKAPILLLLAGVASLLFWAIEALWKSFQHAYYARIKAIEDFYASKLPELSPLQINHSWLQSFLHDRWHTLLRIACWPHVALPHVVVVGGSVLLLALYFVLPPQLARNVDGSHAASLQFPMGGHQGP